MGFTEELAGSNTTVVQDRPGTEQTWSVLQPDALSVLAGQPSTGLRKTIEDLAKEVEQQNQLAMEQERSGGRTRLDYAPGSKQLQFMESAGKERSINARQSTWMQGMSTAWSSLFDRLNKLMGARPETKVDIKGQNQGALMAAGIMGKVGSSLVGGQLAGGAGTAPAAGGDLAPAKVPEDPFWTN